jgi:hypothetical protein
VNEFDVSNSRPHIVDIDCHINKISLIFLVKEVNLKFERGLSRCQSKRNPSLQGQVINNYRP